LNLYLFISHILIEKGSTVHDTIIKFDQQLVAK